MPRYDEDYWKRVETRDVHPPRMLYKYTTMEVAKIILSNQTLRFQSPLQFNDPFDTQWDIIWPLFTQAAIDYERELMELAIRDPDSWPANMSERFRRALREDLNQIQQLPDSEKENAIQQFITNTTGKGGMSAEQIEFIQDCQRRLRLLCLSEEDRSILMWSHYGDQHHGVVLGFDSKKLEAGLSRPIERIQYQHDLPVLIDHREWSRAIAFGLPNPGMGIAAIEWALTKHSDWAYEKEWRFVTIAERGELGLYEDFRFPKGALAELSVGCKSSEEDVQELVAIAKKMSFCVDWYRMRQHSSKFRLDKYSV